MNECLTDKRYITLHSPAYPRRRDQCLDPEHFLVHYLLDSNSLRSSIQAEKYSRGSSSLIRNVNIIKCSRCASTALTWRAGADYTSARSRAARSQQSTLKVLYVNLGVFRAVIIRRAENARIRYRAVATRVRASVIRAWLNNECIDRAQPKQK